MGNPPRTSKKVTKSKQKKKIAAMDYLSYCVGGQHKETPFQPPMANDSTPLHQGTCCQQNDANLTKFNVKWIFDTKHNEDVQITLQTF